ncbi:MAG: PAS domain S-box protein [Dissulfurispiraceae bacterium]
MFESKDLHYSLIQNCSDVITILKTDGTISYISPSIERVLGYRPDELIGKNAFEMIHPEDLPKVKDAFMQLVQTPNAQLSVEYRFKHKDNSWRTVESTGSNQLSNSIIEGIIVNSRDITERQRAEELLREAYKKAEDEKAKTEAIIAAISDGISIQDTTFRVLYQNQVHKNLVEGDKRGEYCYLAYAKKDDVCDECPMAQSFKDGKTHTVERTSVWDEDVRHVEIKTSPLKDSQGNIIGGLEVVRDITASKVAEERLRESEEKFRRIFEDGPLGMMIAAPDYRIVKANKAFCNMLGYAEEELVGFGIEDLTYGEDREKSTTLSRQLLEGKIPLFGLEKRYVKKTGQIIWVNLTVTTIHAEDGRVLYALGMIEDVSERKIAEQEREKIILELQHALQNIKTLKGLLPICAWCRKIRDDNGYWKEVEHYIREHSDASFTHGICPECLKRVNFQSKNDLL